MSVRTPHCALVASSLKTVLRIGMDIGKTLTPNTIMNSSSPILTTYVVVDVFVAGLIIIIVIVVVDSSNT